MGNPITVTLDDAQGTAITTNMKNYNILQLEYSGSDIRHFFTNKSIQNNTLVLQNSAGKVFKFTNMTNDKEILYKSFNGDLQSFYETFGTEINWFTPSNVKSVKGTAFGDTITAPTGLKVNIDGGAGNDVITGAEDNDRLLGGDGSDYIYGGAGYSSISGGISGNVGNDTMDGGAGNDFLVGGAGVNSISGGAGNDTIIGGAYYNILNGGAGNDSIISGGQEDIIDTGAGNDTIVARGGMHVIKMGTGDKTLQYVDETSNSDEIIMTRNGTLNILNLNNAGFTKSSGYPNDLLISHDNGFTNISNGLTASTSAMIKIGGENLTDVATINTEITSPGDLRANKYTGTILRDSISASDYSSGSSSSTKGIIIDGGAGNDTLIGSDLDDQLLGGDGNDYLVGGAGNDSISGGLGDNNVLDYTGDTVVGGFGKDTVIPAKGGTLDILVDSVRGGAVSYSHEKNDLIMKNDEVDITIKNYLVAKGTDAVVKLNHENLPDVAKITIDIGDSKNFNPQGKLKTNRFTGTILSDSIYGGSIGSSEAPRGLVIDGGAGNDTIIGSETGDKLVGGAGSDSIFGGAGYSSVSGGISDNVGNDTMDGGAGDDFLVGGAGNDSIFGGAGNDTLIGGEGDDYLSGGADNTTIIGGLGNDTMTGGASNANTLVKYDGVESFNEDTYIFKKGEIVKFTGLNLDTVGGTSFIQDSLNKNDLILVSSDGGAGTQGQIKLKNYLKGSGAEVYVGENNLTDVAKIVTEITSPGELKANKFTGTILNDSISAGSMSTSSSNKFITIDGGAGNDTIIGSETGDKLVGGAGSDSIFGGAGYSSISGGISGNVGNDTMDGGAGDDFLVGGTGNDSISGGAGNDTLIGGAGDDYLLGGDGDDVFFGGAGNDTISGAAGRTTAMYDGTDFGSDTYILTRGGTVNISGLETYNLVQDSLNKNNLVIYNNSGIGNGDITLKNYQNTSNVKLELTNSSTTQNNNYNIGLFNEKSSLKVVDNGGTDTISISGDADNLRAIFNVTKDGGSYIYDKDDTILVHKNVLANKNNAVRALSNLAGNPSNGLGVKVNLGNSSEGIENVSVGGSTVDIDTWFDRVKQEVSSWLSGTEFNSTLDAINAYNDNPRSVNITGLISAYNNVNYSDTLSS